MDLPRFKQVSMIRKFQTAWIMTKLFSIEILVRIKQQEVPFPLRFKHMFFSSFLELSELSLNFIFKFYSAILCTKLYHQILSCHLATSFINHLNRVVKQLLTDQIVKDCWSCQRDWNKESCKVIWCEKSSKCSWFEEGVVLAEKLCFAHNLKMIEGTSWTKSDVNAKCLMSEVNLTPRKPLKYPNFRKERNTSNVCIYFKGG